MVSLTVQAVGCLVGCVMLCSEMITGTASNRNPLRVMGLTAGLICVPIIPVM